MTAIWKQAARAAVSAAICALPYAASAADTSTLSQLTRHSGVFENPVNEFISNPTGPMIRSVGDAYGYASSYSLAGFGTLKASATAAGQAELYGRYLARSDAAFTDGLLFTSSGMQGQTGYFTVSLLYDRSLSSSGNGVDGYATDQLRVGVDTFSYEFTEIYQLLPSGCNPLSTGSCSFGTTVTDSGGEAASWEGDVVTVRLPFTFGQSTGLNVSVSMVALATYYEGPNTFTSDAAHSLYWGGISSVTDANGTAVDFSLTSESGTNYLLSQVPPFVGAVPEPSQYALMLGGLGLVVLAARRRRACRVLGVA